MDAEDNSDEKNALLNNLVSRRMEAQANERRRVARQLQDGVNQEVAVLGLLVSDIKRHLPASMSQTHDQLTLLQQFLSALAIDIADLSHELYPATLEHAGLVAALRSYCAEVSRRTGLAVNVSVPANLESVPPDMALCLYRITQAFLEDVTCTSRPRYVTVTLTRQPAILRLMLMADDPKHSVGLGNSRLALPDVDARISSWTVSYRDQTAPPSDPDMVHSAPAPYRPPECRRW
jgi:signal transduction histidine kinase